MKLRLEIKTTDVKQTFETLTGSHKKPKLGQAYGIGNDVALSYMSGYDDELLDSEMLLFFAGNLNALAINLLSSYIYDKLKDDKSAKISINGSDIATDQKLMEEFMLFLKAKEEAKNETNIDS